MNPKDHVLFKRYPLHGTAHLSTGEAPMPYHIYRGYGLFIGGTASSQTARDLLKDEAVTLAQNADGQALMGVWVCDFTEASLGPHHELQFSIFVSPTKNASKLQNSIRKINCDRASADGADDKRTP